MAKKKSGDSKLDQLRSAKVSSRAFTAAEKAAVETLTQAEVDAILSAKGKLGEEFIKKNVPHGMMF